MTELKFEITGTHCKSYKMLIEDVLEDLEVEVTSFDLDEDNNKSTVVVKAEISAEKISGAIESEGGYKVKTV